ncbi:MULTISPECIES: hypothetical protein [Pseudomonas]|uniref:hypothetical protein n=1 Tax=Pseudomonas TaxID=286 RepID=UPI0006D88CB1|nr:MULTISPECIES: hypothetical protein [Pseudomonas]MBD0703699.1 hypothetical protein [Pseudomonas sp. PSB1]RMO43748.1 hypothetical protein ALQ40_200022 [Pseudomonas syringae]
MANRQLSPDIVALIHHVELNESGWWKKGVSQIVKGVLWKNHGAALGLNALHDAIRAEAPGALGSDDELERQLNNLRDQGTVSILPGPAYKLTERAFNDLSVQAAAAHAEQDACEADFIVTCREHCPTLDPNLVWKDFTEALSRAIRVSGANLFRLLVGGKLQNDFDWLHNLFHKVDADNREGLRKVLMFFFNPGNQVCRSQILRFMTAYFFAEATRLNPETLAAINQARKVKTIKVVLDTNFLFSVLQLHDNPADAAALSLVDLAHKSNGKLDIKLYVLPSTLEEAKRVLIAQLHIIERIRVTQAMSRVAMTQPLPSIAKKFFSTAASTANLSAADFFRPYIDELRFILEEKGISVLDAHPSIYHTRQDVIDDVMHEVERETKELPEKRRKGYEALLHDAVLWHAVNDRRPPNNESPFETEYWAVSIDWRLIGFDRAKRAAIRAKLPVVLHPSNLVQLIQFWVPRSPELEESLVDSLRLPLFFQSFDLEDERATLKVLESMSRFENVGDLPESAIRVVLTNRALRARISNIEASNQEVFELVHDELLSHHRNVSQQLEETKAVLDEKEQHLLEERAARSVVEGQQDITAKQIADLESERRMAEQRAEDLENAQTQLQQRLQEANEATNEIQAHRDRAEAAERSLTRIKYVGIFLALPTLLGVGIYFLSSALTPEMLPVITTDTRVLCLRLFAATLPLTLAFCFSAKYVEPKPHLNSWKLSKFLSWVGTKVIVAPALIAGEGIFTGGTWDGIKALLGIS